MSWIIPSIQKSRKGRFTLAADWYSRGTREGKELTVKGQEMSQEDSTSPLLPGAGDISQQYPQLSHWASSKCATLENPWAGCNSLVECLSCVDKDVGLIFSTEYKLGKESRTWNPRAAKVETRGPEV